MNFAFSMTGCKNNRFELNQLWEWAVRNGYTADPDRPADVVVMNTCAVTQSAERKTKQMVVAARKANPKAQIIAFGCLARIHADKLKVDGVVVLPNQEEVIKFLDPKPKADKRLSAFGFGEILPRARALVQVQDGCDNFCSYCSIVLARGRSVSRPIQEIVAQIHHYEKQKFHEVILTGINIAAWGCADTRKPTQSRFTELLKTILDQTTIDRIRLGSLGPQYLDDRIIGILNHPRICRHFHLSLQSGSDSVLKRMNRGYTCTQAERVIRQLKDSIPGAAVTADLIVGFPGETEAEFKETIDFVKRNPLAHIHVFPYSPRLGTAAAKMKPIDESIKRERAKQLRTLAEKQRRHFLENQLGQTVGVLWRKEAKPGWMEGVTDQDIRIVKNGKPARRSITQERITEENIVWD